MAQTTSELDEYRDGGEVPMGRLATVDLDALMAAEVGHDPCDLVVVPGFVRREALIAANAGFPHIGMPGSFPLPLFKLGPGLEQLVADLESEEFRKAIETKFGIDLTGRPSMITLRDRARSRDGQIHLDSKTKLFTVLLYLNLAWEANGAGGRLRFLRGPDSLENYSIEVPPTGGTLIGFVCTPKAWHGHHPFEGERRVLQFNWVTDESVVRHEQFRHRVSAYVKRLNPFA